MMAAAKFSQRGQQYTKFIAESMRTYMSTFAQKRQEMRQNVAQKRARKAKYTRKVMRTKTRQLRTKLKSAVSEYLQNIYELVNPEESDESDGESEARTPAAACPCQDDVVMMVPKAAEWQKYGVVQVPVTWCKSKKPDLKSNCFLFDGTTFVDTRFLGNVGSTAIFSVADIWGSSDEQITKYTTPDCTPCYLDN